MSYIDDIPKYGFGTAFDIGNGPGQTSEEEFKGLLQHAVKVGCRHFDCAPLYGTQKLVGQVLKQSMYSIRRHNFFITSKLPINMMRCDNIDISIRKTLKELQLTYLDLFLIHAPFSTKFINEQNVYPLDNDGNLLLDEADDLLEQAWMKLFELKEKGFVRYIGLSNVNIDQVDRLNQIHQIDVVQMEHHLFHQDRQLFDHCEENDIHYEAYASFGCPARAIQMNVPTFYSDPLVNFIGRENNLTNSQVIIQWLHQQPLSYVIRTDTAFQLEENLNASKDICLTINDLIDLDTLNKRARLYYFDDYKGVARHREYPFKRKILRN